MDFKSLVGALVGRDDGGEADQGVMYTRVGDQVGLELVEIDVEGAVEAKRRGDGADHLSDEAVQVLETGAGDVEVSSTDVVNGFVVDEEGAVRVLDGAVSGEDGVVGFYDGGGDLRGGIDGEFELGLLAIFGGETFEEEGTEAGTRAAAEGVEDQEALERVAVVWVEVSNGAVIWRS